MVDAKKIEERRKKLEMEQKATYQEEQRKKQHAENLQWAEDCIKANFADCKEDTFSVLAKRISEMLNAMETHYGENWRSGFEQFVKQVQQEHQTFDNTDLFQSRSGGYVRLFKMGTKLWKELVPTHINRMRRVPSSTEKDEVGPLLERQEKKRMKEDERYYQGHGVY